MDGEQLRALRRWHGLTQQEVATAAGMRQPDLSAIEHNRRGSAAARARVLSAIRGMVRPSQVLDAPTRRRIAEVLRQHGATEVRVFGSVADGTDRPGSDLDLLARFPAGFDLFDLMNVEQELEDLLGIAVDVVSDSDRTRHALVAARGRAVAL